jgi:hypothetical protein
MISLAGNHAYQNGYGADNPSFENNTGNNVISSTIKEKSPYKYDIKFQNIAMTHSSFLCYKDYNDFTYGDQLSGGWGCGWTAHNQSYDFYFSGKNDTYQSSQNLKTFDQSYQFTGSGPYGLQQTSWNFTDNNSSSVWNRALGKSSDTTGLQTQSSNWNVSTSLTSSTSTKLLGLQAINPFAENTKDTNINRPQLQTAYRRVDDNFSGDQSHPVPDDSTTNNINGARAGLVRKPPNR